MADDPPTGDVEDLDGERRPEPGPTEAFLADAVVPFTATGTRRTHRRPSSRTVDPARAPSTQLA
ncbi:MAG: hypothetical protein AB7V15_12025, partial [Acidimicrobiia bacterium]